MYDVYPEEALGFARMRSGAASLFVLFWFFFLINAFTLEMTLFLRTMPYTDVIHSL